jgi:hypothetical protein
MGASDRHLDRFITLRGGFVVPAPAFILMLGLEDRGFVVTREGDTLIVQPGVRLTPDDRTTIRRWKQHLLALLHYCRQPGLDAHLYRDTPPAKDVRHA